MSWLSTPTIPDKLIFHVFFFIPGPTGQVRLLIQSQCMRYFENQFQKKNNYPFEITFFMVGYGDLMGLNCNRGVMFLFRGDFGCLMYTADFRWKLIVRGQRMRGVGYLMFSRMRRLMFFTWIIRIVTRLMIFPLEKLLLSR